MVTVVINQTRAAFDAVNSRISALITSQPGHLAQTVCRPYALILAGVLCDFNQAFDPEGSMKKRQINPCIHTAARQKGTAFLVIYV